jgi:hypothetical protein
LETPAGLRAQVDQRIASLDDRRTLSSRILGDRTMKTILISSTAVTAIVGAALVLAPGMATASTPLATFNGMHAALAAAAHSGELAISCLVTKDGLVSASATLDGQPLPSSTPMNVHVDRDGDTFDITVTVDMSPSNYSSIKFGKDHSTLELVPKGSKNDRIEIGLDPTSLLPKTWTSYEESNGAWKVMSQRDYSPKATGKPSVSSSEPIVARIKVKAGDSGKMAVTGSGTH